MEWGMESTRHPGRHRALAKYQVAPTVILLIPSIPYSTVYPIYVPWLILEADKYNQYIRQQGFYYDKVINEVFDVGE